MGVGGEHTRSLLPLSGTVAVVGTVIPGGKQTPKVFSFTFSSSRCCCCCCCCFILGITRSRRPPLQSQVHPRQTKRNPSLSFGSGSFNGSVFRYPLLLGGVADRPRRRERSVRRRCCVRGAFALRRWRKKKEDEEASVFYASFAFFSKSHVVFVGQSGIFQFFFFFFFPPRTRARHVGRPRNPGPESRALNNRGP